MRTCAQFVIHICRRCAAGICPSPLSMTLLPSLMSPLRDSYADAAYRLYNAGMASTKEKTATEPLRRKAQSSAPRRPRSSRSWPTPSMHTSFTLDFKLTPQALQGVWRYEERDPDSDYVEYRADLDGEESIRIFYNENYSGIDH